MKKLFAVICALALIFALVGCGTSADEKTESNVSSSPSSKRVAVDDEDETSDVSSKTLPVLKGDDEYVVVGRKGDAKLTSVKELAGKKVGYIFDTDSQLIAEYYAGTPLVYNTDHDAYSGMNDKSKVDYIIVSKIGAESRTGGETGYIVVLDNIVIE